MRNLPPLILLLLFALQAHAQQPPMRSGNNSRGPAITGKISGILRDSLTNGPVEFATIVLVQSRTQKQLDGVISDDKGAFKIPEAKLGLYELHISFLGYQPKIVKGIELTPENPDFDAGTILLLSENINLEEVTVVDQRALVENKIDKIVYNAEKDVTTVGGNAADILAKVPLLSVDLEGNVSLRGSSNVMILINGKPSTIFSTNLADALKSIPADQIKNIEVVTSPTAKYDGEGTAGIINIVTKKKNAEGFTGTVNTSVGTNNNRGSISTSLAKGRFGLNANASTWLSWPLEGNTEFHREDQTAAGMRTFHQSGVSTSNNYGPRGTLSAFYDINAFNSISSSLTFGGHGGQRNDETLLWYFDPAFDLDQFYNRINDSEDFRGHFDWTTDYRRTFKKTDQELSFAVQVSGSQSNQENLIQQIGNDISLSRNERNENDGLNLETTYQVDYVQPFGENIKLETGSKGVIRRIDSDYSYENFDYDAGQFLTDTRRSNVFNYHQDVLSAYASFNIKLGEKYGLVAGARYEHTTISGTYDHDIAGFSNYYDNLLPSVILQRKLKDFSSIKLSYSKRIQRPSLFFINPFVNQIDNRDITFGNPDLAPELTDQFELAYNTFIKGVVLNASLYFKNTTDIIESFLQIDEGGVSTTTFRNIGENNSVGFNFFASANIKKTFTVNGNVDIFTYDARSTLEGLNLSNQALLWSSRLNLSWALKKGWRLEAFGFFRAPSQNLQGRRPSFWMYSMGARKELFNKRASLGINATEPFNQYKRWPSELRSDTFYQKSLREIPFRSFNLNFSYTFGKLDFRERQRRSRIRNEDLKGAEGNMQQ